MSDFPGLSVADTEQSFRKNTCLQNPTYVQEEYSLGSFWISSDGWIWAKPFNLSNFLLLLLQLPRQLPLISSTLRPLESPNVRQM